MSDNKKYKVGITVKEPWAENISYEILDMTLFRVEDGGDGCAYVALKNNIGVRPNQDPTTWRKATQRGQSIYDYCIEYGLFEGTEEEFAQDYADAVQAAKDAAAAATHVEEEVSASEQGRVSAENARVSAESQRASAEDSRVAAEAQRSVNETGRVNAEDSRVVAENGRVVAESQRVSAESTRATNEENRRAEFGGMMRDAETAIGLVDTAMTEAENVNATVNGMIVTITDRNGVSRSVNIGFDIYRTYGSIAAMNADAANVEDGKFVMIATLDPTSTENAQLWVRNSNAATSQNPFTFISDLDQASSAAWADWIENQKPIIEADHATAQADHTTAVSDHTTASRDHSIAAEDHATAFDDHIQAGSDRTRAGQDHLVAEQDHTRAEGDHSTASTDHSTAQSDHTTAGTDHTTASSDHTIASGDHTTALSDHDIASGDHTTAGTDHTRAESDHTTASSDHGIASDDHTLAASDHSTASSDHGIASTDHTTAQGDHTQAGEDHTRAGSDHSTASDDHTQAASDHTLAGTDHTTAATDHTNAASDHTQAGEDHAQYLLDHESIASKANVAPNPTEGNVAALDENGNPVDSGIPSEKVAKTDGSYKTMAVGIADNLAGRSIVTGSFFERPTGGVADVANGLGQIQEVQGGSIKFNQLVKNGFEIAFSKTNTGSSTSYDTVGSNLLNLRNPTTEHICYVRKKIHFTSQDTCRFYFVSHQRWANGFFQSSADSAIITENNNANDLLRYMLEPQKSVAGTISFFYIDLTDIFGAGNEPETVEAFEAWLAENVGTQEYYDYTEGEVVNNSMEGIETIGFNLLDPATGKAEIIGVYSEAYDAYYGITGTYGTLTFEDRLGNTSTITPDSDGKFLLEVEGTLTVATPSADCAVFLWWDGSKTEYEPYERNVAYIDVKHIYGKKNGEGNLVQVWPTGMPRINDVVDKLCIENGAVVAKRHVAEVDLGDLTWSYQTDKFGTEGIRGLVNTHSFNCATKGLCSKYEVKQNKESFSNSWDKVIYTVSSGNTYVVDSAYSDADVFKSAVDGVMFYFELATPETYTDLVYMGSEYFADGTPVTLPVNYQENNWGVERILPMNTSEIKTAKPTLVCKYSIDAVETLDTHTTQIEDLYDKNAELDAKKPNKQGDYPQMSVGSAETLKGNTISSGEYTFRKTGGSPVASGLAQINKVKGKTLVWNQLITGAYVNNPTAQTGEYTATSAQFKVVANHKYYASVVLRVAEGEPVYLYFYESNIGKSAATTNIQHIGRIYEVGGSPTANQYLRVRDLNNPKQTKYIYGYNCVDLTLMFGAGNEPSTAAEFEALYPFNYYAYNAGSLINNAASAIESVGFNQWDEQWENGTLDTTTGANINTSVALNQIRSKNFIPVIPSAIYYIKNTGIWVALYDKDKNIIPLSEWSGGVATSGNMRMGSASTFTTSGRTAYMRFYMVVAYGNTYKNDICINISDASKNGTYEPYDKHTCNLNLTTLTGKLNGEGESVVVFPDGMKSVGTTYDEAYGSTGIVKIGSQLVSGAIGDTITLTGCDTTATTFLCASDIGTLSGGVLTLTAAATNVEVYFVLAEPKTYVLDNEIPVGYLENGGGTEKRLPEDTASVVNAPLNIDMIYPIDVVKQLQEMSQNYLSTASLDALLSTLGTACNGTFSKTWDSTNGKYTFSFTPNAEPQPEQGS